MANKYLSATTAGALQEVEATVTSAGAGDAGKIVGLNASGLIDDTCLPTSSSTTMTASENIVAGDLINIWNSSGVKIRKADASAGIQADGYALEAISTSASGAVNLGNGNNTFVSGLTVGARYFLDDAGGVTTTAPTGSGDIVQYIGVAKATDQLVVNLGPPIVRA